jgi:hypothetical protein
MFVSLAKASRVDGDDLEAALRNRIFRQIPDYDRKTKFAAPTGQG